MALSPRHVGLLSLLALLPVAAFLVSSARLTLLTAGLTSVNVALITASLFYMFGDASEHVAHGGVAN
jgi:uncharacterized membrane protein